MVVLTVCIIRCIVLFERSEKVDHEARPAPPPQPSQGFCGLCWPRAASAAWGFTAQQEGMFE